MVSEPAPSLKILHDEPSSELQAQLVKAQSESVQLRREVLRWKMLARQHEDRLKEIESSRSWRIFGIVRILPELRHRWKLLLLVGILACISLPFWPLLAILMCFTSGRDLIWRLLWKIPPLRELMGFVRQNILNRIGGVRSEATNILPLIFQRPTNAEQPTKETSNERLYWLLLQQLCPQRRLLLQNYGLTQNSLIRDEETPDLVSLSRTEISVLGISMETYLATKSGGICTQ